MQKTIFSAYKITANKQIVSISDHIDFLKPAKSSEILIVKQNIKIKIRGKTHPQNIRNKEK